MKSRRRNRPLNVKPVKCRVCGYNWMPRKANPVACPNCQSVSWNGGRSYDW